MRENKRYILLEERKFGDASLLKNTEDGKTILPKCLTMNISQPETKKIFQFNLRIRNTGNANKPPTKTR